MPSKGVTALQSKPIHPNPAQLQYSAHTPDKNKDPRGHSGWSVMQNGGGVMLWTLHDCGNHSVCCPLPVSTAPPNSLANWCRNAQMTDGPGLERRFANKARFANEARRKKHARLSIYVGPLDTFWQRGRLCLRALVMVVCSMMSAMRASVVVATKEMEKDALQRSWRDVAMCQSGLLRCWRSRVGRGCMVCPK
jgi:hypothetical protein